MEEDEEIKKPKIDLSKLELEDSSGEEEYEEDIVDL